VFSLQRELVLLRGSQVSDLADLACAYAQLDAATEEDARALTVWLRRDRIPFLQAAIAGRASQITSLEQASLDEPAAAQGR
jgi:hypothetical protein